MFKKVKYKPMNRLYRNFNNNINSEHYKIGGLETIDYIKAKLTKEEYKGYLKGNVIKYISRAGYKDKNREKEDIRKAIWYLEKSLDI